MQASYLQQGHSVAFTLRFGSLLNPQRFVLPGNVTKVIRIGRAKQNDVVLPLPGISWFHAELRLLPQGSSSLSMGAPALCIVDLSTNHTGMRTPGGSVEPLPKGVLTPVQDGSLFVLPMKVKSVETDPSKRMCFRVDFERIPPTPMPAVAPAQPQTVATLAPAQPRAKEESWSGKPSPAPPQPRTREEPRTKEESWSGKRVDVKVLATCDSGGTSLDFRMRPETRFAKMMHAWCRHHNVAEGEAVFRLGNRVLRPEDSASLCGWMPGRGALVVEAMPRQDVAEEDASMVPGHDNSPSRASCAASFLKIGFASEDEASPDLITYNEDTEAAWSARVERERAAKLLRDALHDEDEESDHLSGPSPDSSMLEEE